VQQLNPFVKTSSMALLMLRFRRWGTLNIILPAGAQYSANCSYTTAACKWLCIFPSGLYTLMLIWAWRVENLTRFFKSFNHFNICVNHF